MLDSSEKLMALMRNPFKSIFAPQPSSATHATKPSLFSVSDDQVPTRTPRWESGPSAQLIPGPSFSAVPSNGNSSATWAVPPSRLDQAHAQNVVAESPHLQFQRLRQQLPPSVPDWTIQFINQEENITPEYLAMVCKKIQDPTELKELLLEPKVCREHKPFAEKVCMLHLHLGLHHKTISCGSSLPWTRRVKLADINGICTDFRICIMKHWGPCKYPPKQCEICGANHFLVWCVKNAKLRKLYDIKDNIRIKEPAGVFSC